MLALSRRMQAGVRLSTYVLAAFGMATNAAVMQVIWSPSNRETFKDLKHYTYLALNSAFGVFIFALELLVWLSECFWPAVEAFCPETRKLVGVQLFKMIGREALGTALRFMVSFSYFAFALSRIGLVGQKQIKLIRVVSEAKLWQFFVFTASLSVGLSWIKFFKYSVNWEQSDLNFPVSKEFDLLTPYLSKSAFFDFYFVYNCMSDLVNYVLFVAICFVIDLVTVIKLKRVLKEKLNRLQKMNANKSMIMSKTIELEDAVHRNARLVVVNTIIGLLLKLPGAVMPVINAYAQFYYKVLDITVDKPAFDQFYTFLFDTGLYFLFQDLANFFYLLSLSLQYFIYNRFDIKFNLSSSSSLSPKN